MSEDIIDDEPLIQYAQKCPFCGYYLLAADDIRMYYGKQKRFHRWMVHTECIPINDHCNMYRSKYITDRPDTPGPHTDDGSKYQTPDTSHTDKK